MRRSVPWHARRFCDSGTRSCRPRAERDALRLARNFQGRIHLLLTDIMMPGMNGLEVAASVTRFRPGIRVFFMSGYADQDLLRQGLLDPDTPLLHKPFSPQELGARVRAILDLPSKS